MTTNEEARRLQEDASRLLKLVLEGQNLSKEQSDSYRRLMAVLRGLTVDEVIQSIERHKQGEP